MVNLSNTVVAVSATSIACGIKYLYTYFADKNFHESLNQLRRKVKKNWKNNPNIEKLNVKCENTIPLSGYGDIQFFVKVIASEKFAKARPAEPDAKPARKFNPFSAENCAKIYVENMSETHALLYNKFPLVPFHVLIVTKKFEKQMSLLGERDFDAALRVMKALDSFAFFNGGPNAGASQEHKHIQAIPYGSFPNQTIPLDALIEATKSGEEKFQNGIEYSQVAPFKFKHVLCKFKPNLTQGLAHGEVEVKGKLIASVYLECLKKLNNEDLHLAYNFVLTKHWMFMVLRTCETALGMIKINAVGFTGSFAVRSDEEYEFIRKQDPIKILHSVTYPL